MFGRHEKVKILTILLFWLLALPQWAEAEWLCPRTLQTFATADECSLFCPGVDCIESGTYMCSADTDGDGQTELYQCREIYQCPLGNYPCDESHRCRVSGTCTENTKQVQKIFSPVLGPFGHTISTYDDFRDPNRLCQYLTGHSDAKAVSYTCAPPPIRPQPCDFRHNGEWYTGGCYGENWCTSTGVGSITCEYTESSYGCSLDGQTYDDLSSCQSACVQTADCTSSWQCPVEGGTECEDVSVAENYEDEPPDLSYYRDDGQVDPDTGACLGQIYVFAGRPMMCRRSGAQTGFHNCCDADDEVVHELNDQLSALGGTFAVVSKLKDAVSLASKAIELYNTASKYAQALGTALDKSLLQEAAVSLNTPTPVYNAVLEAVQNGGGAIDGALNSIVNGLGLTPTGIITQIALNFALDFAMKIFLGGCSEDDVMTAAYNELGLCHYVGTKCVKKLPVIGCVQKANIFCCFNSKLARIIHEQGRPQLKNFGGWGTTDYPNCRGFTPDEFQMLDFSRIDLSEWYGDIETRVQSDIEENVRQNLENFRQNIR